MILLILAVLGLCLGSFVNAYVWRVYKQDTARSKRTKHQKYSVLHGRSMCPNCQHVLAPKDLIPLLSWVSLSGRCRYCRQPISAQYPLVELLTAVLFMVSYVAWPETLSGIAWLPFVIWLGIITNLVALAVYDLKWMLLPNRMLVPLAILAGIFVGLLAFSTDSFDPLTGALWGSLIGGGLFWVLFQLSNGRWIGGGDVKLGAVLGIIVGGPMNAILLLFISSLLGTLVSVPLMVTGKASRTSKLPFGPFLIAAAWIVALYGERIVRWYNQLVGL